MSQWYMLTVVGRDQPGIVAEITGGLYEAGFQLGETSMMRLGGNFTMMLMVRCADNAACDPNAIADKLQPRLDKLDLKLHVDAIEGHLHEHVVPNLRVSVYGTDRPGIVARVTSILQQQGFNIHDLESDVGGTDDKPIYIMHIEGYAECDEDALQTALTSAGAAGLDVRVYPIDTLIG